MFGWDRFPVSLTGVRRWGQRPTLYYGDLMTLLSAAWTDDRIEATHGRLVAWMIFRTLRYLKSPPFDLTGDPILALAPAYCQ
jgi:hypothetical protein